MLIALLIIGVILIIFSMKSLKKDRSIFSDTFQNAQNNIDDVDIKIGKFRTEFSETVLEIQLEIEKLREDIEILNKKLDNNDLYIETERVCINKNLEDLNKKINKGEEKSYDIKVESKATNFTGKINENHEELADKNEKIIEIKKLLQDNLSVEEISEKLGLGKGEVLLIKELYLK